ncbi:MAG: AIR synthase-related protein, partial [Bacteroidales bacterium]
VGDPFQEKLLLEASLEIIKTGAVVGMQDMGAAGIICSTSEMSAKGKHGMIVWLDKVPLRQTDMNPWEILLSESQERMLVVIEKGREDEVNKIFDKWDLNCVQIGEVVEGDRLKYYWHGELVADVHAESLVLGGGAPIYQREYKEPSYYSKTKKFKIEDIEEPSDLKKVAYFILKQPSIASKKWIVEQYDTMVGTKNMSTNAPSDAAVVNIKGTDKAIVLTTDCNSRYVYADPQIGCEIAVSEAARNIVCSGGEPSAITNCLNFGNPYHPGVYWQFVGAIKGMSEACIKFNTPVTGGNVSFYNQSAIGNKVEPVFPTPVIGMLGIMPDKQIQMTLDFKNQGDMIFLIGQSRNDIACSEYLYKWHKVKLSPPPYFNIDEEYEIQNTIKQLIRQQLINSAHDVSDGGLFVTLFESAMHRDLGFDITSDAEIRMDAFLFGEAQGRVVVTIPADKEDDFLEFMSEKNVEFCILGQVKGTEMIIDDVSFGLVKEARSVYENVIPSYMKS